MAKAKMAGKSPDRGSLPLYVQVATALKEEIVDGLYPVGSLLPTEDNLCERFGVSRYTVREALRLLREDGLVSSRRGAGTIVIPSSTSGSDIHQVMSVNDLVAFAADTSFVIESTGIIDIDEKLARRTGLPPGEKWLEILGYRHGKGSDTPVCRTEYYINRDFAAVGRLLQRNNGPIFTLIEDLFGQTINEVQQQISATCLGPRLANQFKVDIGSAALEVRRSYKTADGKIAQITFNIHPADRYQHSMTMRRIKT